MYKRLYNIIAAGFLGEKLDDCWQKTKQRKFEWHLCTEPLREAQWAAAAASRSAHGVYSTSAIRFKTGFACERHNSIWSQVSSIGSHESPHSELWECKNRLNPANLLSRYERASSDLCLPRMVHLPRQMSQIHGSSEQKGSELFCVHTKGSSRLLGVFIKCFLIKNRVLDVCALDFWRR